MSSLAFAMTTASAIVAAAVVIGVTVRVALLMRQGKVIFRNPPHSRE